LDVKVEEPESTLPLDPFPSAIVHEDENSELDVLEAERNAPVVSECLASEVLQQRRLLATLSSSAGSAESKWTVYTEIDASGPKCFVPETQFVNLDGTLIQVQDIRIGDELQGPGISARVQQVTQHAFNRRPVVVLSIQMPFETVRMRITRDHRMTVQNGDCRRAGELRPGDLLSTSEGEFEVMGTEELIELIPVFEINFEEDRPVYVVVDANVRRDVTAFGSEHRVPYDPNEYVEFRFKGHICTTMGFAETWLRQEFQCQLDGFGLKFWCSRKYAVWAPRDRCNEFWEMVANALPRGSKLYRRPATLSMAEQSFYDTGGISTPQPLTP